jgi:4-carboxymuconolactone decarboxylase
MILMTQNELIIELNNLTANWLQDVDENCAQHLTTDRLLIPIIACTTQGTTTKIAVLAKKL